MSDFSDLPGYVTDGNGMGHEAVPTSGGTNSDAVLRLAWLIVILSLIGLWALGYTFKG